MDDRELMLARIRSARDSGRPRSARAGSPAATAEAGLAHDTGAPRASAIPRDYRRTGTLLPGSDAVLERLTERLVDYRAEVVACTEADLPTAVRVALGGSRTVVLPPGLSGPIREACAADGREIAVDGEGSTLSADELDRIDAVLTGARVAIADTGVIILDGSPDQGRRAISLVPDLHVVVLHGGLVVQSVPEALAQLEPTRPLTMIAGPSATSDIELSRVEGVHGPRTLRVIIVR